MTAVKIPSNSTSQIFKSIQQMIILQGFKYNDDLSDTDVGKYTEKEFKLVVSQVDNSDRSNRQKHRVTGIFEISLYHKARQGTEEVQLRASDDAENIMFAIERFAPTGSFVGAQQLKEVVNFVRWITEPIKTGDDSCLRTLMVFEITYVINNPKAT